MRIVIQQGSKFIDGDGSANSNPSGGFVALVSDITNAHDFKTTDAAETWMTRKDISGKILEVYDGE